MANSVNFSTYGFLDDILALNEDNWRNFFKPIVYDSVQSGLEVTAGIGMTVNVSTGECRCGSIMGISNSQISLDVNVGNNTYSRIDSVVIQYTYGDPSTLSVAILEGEPSASPVPPTLTKSYNSLWQMEIAQILVPSNVTTASECTITDKRIIYNSLDSVITPIKEDKADNGAVALVFSETETYAVDDCVMYQGKLYKFLSAHNPGPWIGSSEVVEINALAQSSAWDAQIRKNILYYTNQTVSSATSAQIMRIPASGTDNDITTDTVVLDIAFNNSSYITSNISWVSYAGYVTFTGTCTAVTSANVILGRKGN